MTSPIVDFLLTRNSAPIPELREPAPSDAEIETMLRAYQRHRRGPDEPFLEFVKRHTTEQLKSWFAAETSLPVEGVVS